MNIKIKTRLGLTGLLGLAVMMTGCGKQTAGEEEFYALEASGYEKNIRQSVAVLRGDIVPSLELILKPDDYKVTTYSTIKDCLEVEKIYVDKGDFVTAGTVMVKFKDDDIEEKISDYRKRLDENKLLMEHYIKLQSIDSKADYEAAISSLKSDNEIVEAYLKEEQAKLLDYQIIADIDGVVIDMDSNLFQGMAFRNSSLVKVASGSDNYFAETSDDYEFKVGQEFAATHGVAEYRLKVIDVLAEGGNQKITFKPVSDMAGVSKLDTLNVIIEKEVVKDALHVNKKAVVTVDDIDYVFTVDDKGYRHAREVVIRDIIDDEAIIETGISEGEWVTLEW